MYNIANWGGKYFDINNDGHLVARAGSAEVDMYSLIDELKAQGLSLPVLVRFQHILRDRVDQLCNAMHNAMHKHDYLGRYTAVYPIKVNQQRSVVEEILNHGGERVGLEAGSKPELMAVMALSSHHDGVIICNGYKDSEYIRLALIGGQLGQRVYIVIEKPSELELVIRESRALGIRPLLGMRVRLATLGEGKWQNTGGDKAKFGLSATQTLALVARLKSASMLDCMQLMHFHMGSQIANLRDIDHGLREAGRYYAELQRMGVALQVMDVGGGLGIDYEGTCSRSFCSRNYSLQEYADLLLQVITKTCSEQGIPQPDIITEAGRAMTAHHAVLITNVIDADSTPVVDSLDAPAATETAVIQHLWRLYSEESLLPVNEFYHEINSCFAEIQVQYSMAVLDLPRRAWAEQVYFSICRRLLTQSHGELDPDLADELRSKLADKYFCNFSIFQSIPDVWAFNQIFPIMPLHRLHEAPTRRAVLQDLTCDSDGRIDSYVDNEGIESTLPVHEYRSGQPYYLGVFLVGAYQEILGDLHNLFGDTHSINVELQTDGDHQLLELEHGDRVDELLRYVHFDTDYLLNIYKKKIESVELAPELRAKFLQDLRAGLAGYTYLED